MSGTAELFLGTANGNISLTWGGSGGNKTLLLQTANGNVSLQGLVPLSLQTTVLNLGDPQQTLTEINSESKSAVTAYHTNWGVLGMGNGTVGYVPRLGDNKELINSNIYENIISNIKRIGIGITTSATSLLDLDINSNNIDPMTFRVGLSDQIFGTITTLATGTDRLNGGLRIVGDSFNVNYSSLTLDGRMLVSDPTDSVPAILMRGYKGVSGNTALGTSETLFRLDNATNQVVKILGNGFFGLNKDPVAPIDIQTTSGGADGALTTAARIIDYTINGLDARPALMLGIKYGANTLEERAGISTSYDLNGELGCLDLIATVSTSAYTPIRIVPTYDKTGGIILNPASNSSISLLGSSHVEVSALGTSTERMLKSINSSGRLSFASIGTDYDSYATLRTEPTGFPNRTDTTVNSTSLNTSNRLFTLIKVNNFTYYIAGVSYPQTASMTVTISNTTGIHFIYATSSNTLVDTMTFPGTNVALVAAVYWNATYSEGWVLDERHGLITDWSTHNYLHDNFGMQYDRLVGGGTITFPTNTTFNMTGFTLWDEDIRFDVPESTTCRVLYRDGSLNWRSLASQTRYYLVGSGGNIQYDNAGTLTEVGVNEYVAMWVYGSNSTSNNLWFIVGQRKDTTIANARLNNTPESLSLGSLPGPEMKLLYRIIIRQSATIYQEQLDYRTTPVAGTAFTPTNHSLLSGLSYAASGHTGFSPEVHNLVDTTNHPVSGLTTGHFLKATGATTYGFAAHGLTYSDVGACPALSLTQYRIPRAATTTTLGDSPIYTDSGNTMVGIGISPTALLDLDINSLDINSVHYRVGTSDQIFGTITTLINDTNRVNGGLRIIGDSFNAGYSGATLEGRILIADPTDNIPAVLLRSYKGASGDTAFGNSETIFRLDNATTPRMTIFGDGSTTLSKYAGSGDRVLAVDSNGLLKIGTAGTDFAAASHTHVQGDITSLDYLFNNSNLPHSTYTDFNAIDKFGFRYVQGATNGPGISGATQYYNIHFGLGSDYAVNNYGMQMAIPRVPEGGTPYLSVRYMESGTWGSWAKIRSGYSDSAGDSDTLDGSHASAFAPSFSLTQYRIPRLATASTFGDSPIYTNSGNTLVGIGDIGTALFTNYITSSQDIDHYHAKVQTLAHGVTGVLPTDAFFGISTYSNDTNRVNGGAKLIGISGNAGYNAIKLWGIATSNPTDSVATVRIDASRANGTGTTTIADAETLVDFANNGTAKVTILGSGDIYNTPWTNWNSSATYDGWSSIGSSYYRYKIVGKTMYLKIGVAGVSDGTDGDIITITTPNDLYMPNGSQSDIIKFCIGYDNGTNLSTPCLIQVYGTNLLKIYKDCAFSSWTKSGNKGVYIDIEVQLA